MTFGTTLALVSLLLILVQVIDIAVRQVIGDFLRNSGNESLAWDGLPASAQDVLLVVPVIVVGLESVEAALNCLERNIAADRDFALPVALVTDMFDSRTREHPLDAHILAKLVDGLEAISHKHLNDVYLLHRERTWNPGERVWMGWERKRGKLLDLNRFLMGEEVQSLQLLVGERAGLAKVSKVITLDVDATLQSGGCSALSRRLDEIMASEGDRRTCILQPLPCACIIGDEPGSLFERMQCAPLSATVEGAAFDPYQHFFSQGSFYGKGIYQVKQFHEAAVRAAPANLLLSHDILEGALAGSQMCCDIKIYEPVPGSLRADLRRRHRWTRGDWQLAPYLFLPLPARFSPFVVPKLSGLSKWKLLDNLRRSLTPIAFTYGYFYAAVAIGNASLLAIILFASALSELIAYSRLIIRATTERRHTGLLGDLWLLACRSAVLIALTPTAAWISVNAIATAIWRLYVSKQGLLEWEPYGDPRQNAQGALLKRCAIVIPSVATAVFLYSLVVYCQREFSVGVYIVLFAWVFSPMVLCLERRPKEG